MLRSGLAVDSAGLSLAGLPGDASPAVVLPSDSQLTFRSRFPASSETNFRRFRGTRVPGCIRGLAAGGLASEPTVSPFRARCLVQHPVESPFELPHRTKGPSDVNSSVRLQRRRLASPVLPLRRPTGPASNTLSGVPDGSLTRTPATHFPVGSTVFGISAVETTATAPQRCCDSSVTNLRRCRGTQGSGVHPGPPTDGLTSEQALLRFRSWHHRFPGHTGRSFDRPAPLALPSESPVQHPMELPFSLAGPWLPHRTIRTTSRQLPTFLFQETPQPSFSGLVRRPQSFD